MHYYSFKQVAFYYLSAANTEECTLTNQQNIHGCFTVPDLRRKKNHLKGLYRPTPLSVFHGYPWPTPFFIEINGSSTRYSDQSTPLLFYGQSIITPFSSSLAFLNAFKSCRNFSHDKGSIERGLSIPYPFNCWSKYPKSCSFPCFVSQ